MLVSAFDESQFTNLTSVCYIHHHQFLNSIVLFGRRQEKIGNAKESTLEYKRIQLFHIQ